MPFHSGERTGVKHRLRPKAVAVSSVYLATVPLSDNHSTACGVLLIPNRRSTQATITPREPLAGECR